MAVRLKPCSWHLAVDEASSPPRPDTGRSHISTAMSSLSHWRFTWQVHRGQFHLRGSAMQHDGWPMAQVANRAGVEGGKVPRGLIPQSLQLHPIAYSCSSCSTNAPEDLARTDSSPAKLSSALIPPLPGGEGAVVETFQANSSARIVAAPKVSQSKKGMENK